MKVLNIYAGINATKTLCHVLKLKRTKNVSSCKVETPMMYLNCYEDLYARRYQEKEAKAEEVATR